ncbi:flagellar hook-length control protein FliK [Parasphingorhabdus sp.]|uniref:flagellar hook-length control protein FliK n=1 Tax=Parasphingorhabdus sp. TaxID=2709688 RepID=UPI003A94920C
MIGKLMSEAAHSVIGMFSARPVDMENNSFNSDFDSLLRSSEDESQAGVDGMEIDTLDIDAVPAEFWGSTDDLPVISQGFGNTMFNQAQFAGNVDPGSIATDPVESDVPEGKTSLPFNQDAMINRGGLRHIPSIAFAADGQGGQDSAKLASDIGATSGEADVVDGQLSDERLGKLQGLQQQVRGESNALTGAAAKLLKSNQLGLTDADSSDPQSQIEAGKQAAGLSPLLTTGEEQKAARSELGQFGFRSSQRDASPVVTSSRQTSTIADAEFTEPVKFDAQPAIKSFETAMEQMPLANSSAQLAVRDSIQKPAAFDMNSPQLAERLGAEIADISGNGGTKKFEINPRNLGRMEIIFTTRGSTEIVEIQTDHRAAKDIILQHSQALQEVLKSQGRDDVTLRVDVKENMFSSSRSDGGNLSQQENSTSREQQESPAQNRQMAQTFDSAAEKDPAADNSRYA